MPPFSISEFKSQVTRSGGFSDGHLFRVLVDFKPDAASILKSGLDSRTRPLLGHSVTLPASTVEPVTLNYHTRQLKIPGARTFAPVSVTFFSLNDYSTRSLFARWQGVFASLTTNRRGVLENQRTIGYQTTTEELPGNINDYYATITLEHYANQSDISALWESFPINLFFGGGSNKKVATYILRNAYPSSVGGLVFTHENEGPQTYDVEFQYQSMTCIPGDGAMKSLESAISSLSTIA